MGQKSLMARNSIPIIYLRSGSSKSLFTSGYDTADNTITIHGS